MLNDREQRVLTRMEQELQRSDPAFVRKFAHRRPRRVSGPAMVLVLGLVVMVIGSATVSVMIAILGIGIAAVAVIAAYHQTSLGGSSGAA